MLMLPARAVASWTIACGSASATARATESGSSASPTTALAPSASIAPRLASDRVIPVTSWPRLLSCRTSGAPIAPPAPATKILIAVSFRSFKRKTGRRARDVTGLAPVRNLTRVAAGIGVSAVVTVSLAAQSHATFPGDNGLIAFGTTSKGIYTIEPDGSDVAPIVTGSASFAPDFSPDGKTVVFDTKGLDLAPHLAIVPADGGKFEDIPGTKAAYDPSFSASGDRIAYEHKGDIITIDVDGGHPKRVVKGDSHSPSFSPVGPQITYSAETKHNSINVFTVNANGRHRKQLTSFNHVWAESPSFSPDGKQIIFSADGEIYVMKSNGSDQHAITHTRKVDESRPVFSPDGKLIAYDDSDNIFTMDADGAYPVQVTDGGKFDHGPSWQPLP